MITIITGLFFGFDHPRQFRPWHDRGFAFEDWRELPGHLRQSMPASQVGQGGGLHRGAPPEALLRQLEQMGFRYVPELFAQPASLKIAPIQPP